MYYGHMTCAVLFNCSVFSYHHFGYVRDCNVLVFIALFGGVRAIDVFVLSIVSVPGRLLPI